MLYATADVAVHTAADIAVHLAEHETRFRLDCMFLLSPYPVSMTGHNKNWEMEKMYMAKNAGKRARSEVASRSFVTAASSLYRAPPKRTKKSGETEHPTFNNTQEERQYWKELKMKKMQKEQDEVERQTTATRLMMDKNGGVWNASDDEGDTAISSSSKGAKRDKDTDRRRERSDSSSSSSSEDSKKRTKKKKSKRDKKGLLFPLFIFLTC
jgi:hypothetical protein